MGGKAFTSGPHSLSVPRLPPDVYFPVLEQTIALFQTLFKHVASPPPGMSIETIVTTKTCPVTQRLPQARILT